MKKYQLLWAMMAAMMLPLGFAACSSDDNEEDTTPYVYPTPAQKADAASYKVTNDGAATRSVVFGESGSVVLERAVQSSGVKAVTRATQGEEIVFLVGTYTKEGNVYTIFINGQKWGTIEVVANADGSYILIVTPVGKESEETPAEKEKEVATDATAEKLCRTWTPVATRVKLRKLLNGTQLTSPLFNGCDFESIKQWAQEESDCKISDDFGKDYTVKSIFFTSTGKFCIDFTSGKNYYGTYAWKRLSETSGQLEYEWADLKTMGCSYEDGKATIDFKTGEYKGQCWLNLAADIKSGSDTYHVEVSAHLQ